MLKANVAPALDNVALWFERDMSHSSVERVVIEDSFHMACFGVQRMTRVITNLVVDEYALENNIAREGDFVFSHSVLCHLIRCGITRNEAYGFIQEVTHKGLNLFSEMGERYPSHYRSLPEMREASKGKIDKVFDRILGHVMRDRPMMEGLKDA
jgi:adenylosuccinate lyase